MSLPSPIPIVYRSVTGLGFRVILVGVLGTTYKDYTDELELADLNLDYHKIKNPTHTLNEHSIRHASTLIRTRYALQYNLSNNSRGVGLGATAYNPPDPH
jgi:hypothetical protein